CECGEARILRETRGGRRRPLAKRRKGRSLDRPFREIVDCSTAELVGLGNVEGPGLLAFLALAGVGRPIHRALVGAVRTREADGYLTAVYGVDALHWADGVNHDHLAIGLELKLQFAETLKVLRTCPGGAG